MNIAASEKEYLDWFYHTMRHSCSGVKNFEQVMADKFKYERGLLCPFHIPEVKSASVTSDSE